MVEDPSIALRLRVRGKVQGVFYRDWTVENARALGLAGWVRNEPDGSVAAHLEGPEATVRTMIARMHQGPPAARVANISEQEAQVQAAGTFERR